MSTCRTCVTLDCSTPSDLDFYSLQQPSVIPAVQSGRITLSDIDSLCVGEYVSVQITASGSSVDGYSEWTILGGSLPDGLTLTPHGFYATISGTTTVIGQSTFSILVESTNGDRGSKVYRLNVFNCGLSCGRTVSGSFDSGNAWCYETDQNALRYEVDLVAGQSVTFTLNTSGFGGGMDLFSPGIVACSGIVESSDFVCDDGSTPEVLTYNPPTSGKYVLQVVGCFTEDSGTYTLEMSCE